MTFIDFLDMVSGLSPKVKHAVMCVVIICAHMDSVLCLDISIHRC